MTKSNSILDQHLAPYLYTTRRDVFILQHFLLGFLLYSTGFCLASTGIISGSACNLIQAIGLALLFPTSFFLFKRNTDNILASILFPIYIAWNIFAIIRGWDLDYEATKIFLFSGWFGAFIFLGPTIFLFPRNLVFVKKYFQFIVVLGIVYMALNILFIQNLLVSDREDFLGLGLLEIFAKTLAAPLGFILLTFRYHSRKINLLAVCILVWTLFLALIKARRGLTFMVASTLMISYLVFLKESKAKFPIIVISALIGSVILIYGINFFFSSSLFDLLRERALEDSRTGVEVCFYQDMQLQDWIFGRGMNGKYLCPEVHADFEGYRHVIETDYLNIILKAGLISLVIFLIIAIPAMIKGLFFSKNNLARAAGIWIFIGLINMYPTYVKTFTFNYLLIWIAIGICHSKSLRNIDELTMRNYFKNIKMKIWEF